jgi:hypothetical protein
MISRLLVIWLITMAIPMACSDAIESELQAEDTPDTHHYLSPPKSDRDTTIIEQGNAFFITQIYDQQWNPTGSQKDLKSNNCGPTSFAMLMAQRSLTSKELTPSAAIDHARAMMYPTYPNIKETELSQGAYQYMSGVHLCINDNHQSVYFDITESEPSIAQGIRTIGGNPIFGYTWKDIRQLLTSNGSLIAHGYITDEWRQRFPGTYGHYTSGSIPHFIAIFSTSSLDSFLVCDPMHLGGPVLMTQNQLQTFFKSPINVFETTIRVITWPRSIVQENTSLDERRNEPREP